MRRWLSDTGLFGGVAAALLVVGVLSVLLEVQSPSFVLIAGIKVHGYTQAGVTYYSYDGERHVIDNVHAPAWDETRRPTTVWLSREHPDDESKAYIENGVIRWIDLAETGGWFVLSIGFLLAAALRKRHVARTRARYIGLPGGGIPDDLMRRLLDDRRGSR